MTIQELRKDRRMTQRGLADALHVTNICVSRWERGVTTPSAESLRKIAEIFGVPMDSITLAPRHLTYADIFTEEADGLTPEERRGIYRMEQAKEASGWRRYGGIASELASRIPDEWWGQYSPQHIGEVMALLKRAYDDGAARYKTDE